ncbi:hypothetical protein OK016_12330 [Vibrio chagasii]|nr:hypothetical protein [Vibrio chagasii]
MQWAVMGGLFGGPVVGFAVSGFYRRDSSLLLRWLHRLGMCDFVFTAEGLPLVVCHVY